MEAQDPNTKSRFSQNKNFADTRFCQLTAVLYFCRSIAIQTIQRILVKKIHVLKYMYLYIDFPDLLSVL